MYSGGQVVGLILFALGIFGFIRGLQIRFARIPYFVTGYHGWSSPLLSLPFGGIFVFGLGIQSFDALLPLWILELNVVIALPSFLVFMLGMIIWFPPFLLPGWYRRARKAGVPRHDPYAMARFKRLTKAEQRKAKWPNIPEEPDQKKHTK